MAEIVELISYPIKGCAGVSIPAARVTAAGLEHDRSFMVVDPRGRFRSQRRDPALAVIRPRVRGGVLSLAAPNAAALDVTVRETGISRDVSMFGASYRGIDQGDAAANWLSEVLGSASRLVRVPPDHDRVTDGMILGTSGYADSSAVHIVSRESLDDLNARIAAADGPVLSVCRFRPNIVLRGEGEPYWEDAARGITIGSTTLGFTKLAVRCAVTLVDPREGTKAGPEPLRTLAKYRKYDNGGVVFGAKFAVTRPGVIAMTDECRVASTLPAQSATH